MWLFPHNPILWFDWYKYFTLELVPLVEFAIVSASDIEPALRSCTELAAYMLFCGYYQPGCHLLNTVIEWRVQGGKEISARDKLILEIDLVGKT